MASTSVSRVVPAPPERVWQLVGGFHALPDWLPYIPQSRPLEGGRVRELRNRDGELIVERLEEFDERARRYSYSVLKAPFPVRGHLATLRVHAVPGDEQSAEVVWSGRFAPHEATEEEVVDLFDGIFRDGLAALEAALER